MPTTDCPIIRLIERRVDELQYRKNQSEIAKEAGFTNVNNLAMIKTGRSKLSLGRVIPLAKALEIPPNELLKLKLEEICADNNALDLLKFIEFKAA